MILLLTGSCASGKTTIGQLLEEKYDFIQLDGDQLIKDLGLRSKNWDDIHKEIFIRAVILNKRSNVVISHVVLAEIFPRYFAYFTDIDILFKIVILKCNLQNLLERSQIRTCHPKPTPEKFLKHFYHNFSRPIEKDNNILELDNTFQNPGETLARIVEFVTN